jgi:hypothetical protein
VVFSLFKRDSPLNPLCLKACSLIRQLADAAVPPQIYFFSKIAVNEHDTQRLSSFNKKDLAILTTFS